MAKHFCLTKDSILIIQIYFRVLFKKEKEKRSFSELFLFLLEKHLFVVIGGLLNSDKNIYHAPDNIPSSHPKSDQ